MENRILIKSISISNFRSIRKLKLKVNDFNVFVGMNDAGKSNVLKALNLFFNNQVDHNVLFNYARDFSYLYPPKSKEAKAVTIVLQVEVPKSFTGGGIYEWKKIWKETGLVEDKITTNTGNEPAVRSRIPTALRKIKYRYVPAVKSTEYYKLLLEDLYASVAASLDSTLEEAVSSFSSVLSEYTNTITKSVFEKLQLSSVLTVPNELNDIFKALIFRTNKNGQIIEVPLTARGDGIQARHIPIILKFIAEEDQKSRNQGSTKITTIWGFEEPENGLELGNAFLMANDFSEYSKEVQIFMTTHSPAFYMQKEEERVSVFFVDKKTADSEETNVIPEKSTNRIADKMGLMPLIAPFVAEESKKYSLAQKIINHNYISDMPTIITEGKTDIEYLKLAIKFLSPDLNNRIENNELIIMCDKENAGCSQLANWVFAWIYSGFSSPMYALLDKDSAGIKIRRDIVESEIFKNKGKQQKIKIGNLVPSSTIINMYHENIELPFEIEHLLSESVWSKWKQKKLVDVRSEQELIDIFKPRMSRTQTLEEVIGLICSTSELSETKIYYRPKKLKKNKMLDVVKQQFNNDCEAFLEFENTIKELEKYFLF